VFEIHITCASKDAIIAEQVAKTLPNWKTSEITGDPVLGKDAYFYLTYHTDTFRHARLVTAEAINELKKHGVEPVRFKIEFIVHDTKFPQSDAELAGRLRLLLLELSE
jgi:hypothetical protein